MPLIDSNTAQNFKNLGLSNNRLLNLTAMKLAIKSMPKNKLNQENEKQISDDFCNKFTSIKINLKKNDNKFMQNHRGLSMFS